MTPQIQGRRSPLRAERLQMGQQPAPATEPGLASVVVPCFGQLELLRLCAPRLLRHTRAPCELLFLDVGSLDGTAEYLDGLAAAAPLPVEVVHADPGLSLPAA